jgi:hypothetical protein
MLQARHLVQKHTRATDIMGRYIRPIDGTAIYWEVSGVKYWVRSCTMCDDTLPFEHTPCHNHWVNVEQSYIDSLQTGGGFPGSDGVQFECTQHPQYPAYHYGTPAGNTCPTSDVSEADCLAAVQHLLPNGQAQGRTNLVAGSWGPVPPGCSVQSAFTQNVRGDWAAHYNRNSGGQNNGGYTPVCVSNSPVYSTALADTKCPFLHDDRLFRSPASGVDATTLDQCYAECATTTGCNHFSWGAWQGGYVCMGCTTLATAQTHQGFTAYDMRTP